jgi:hypothetical protein
VATDADELLQVTDRPLSALPFWSSGVAVAVAVPPTATDVADSDTLTVVVTSVGVVGVVGVVVPLFPPPPPPPLQAAIRATAAVQPPPVRQRIVAAPFM